VGEGPERRMKPFVVIKGGGIAGQVLRKELSLRGIPATLEDRSRFPRDKVCGGILQADSWEYLNSVFSLRLPARKSACLSTFVGKKKISTVRLEKEMVFVPRLDLDDALHSQNAQARALPGQSVLEVAASGAEHPQGEWIGFQTQHDPVENVQMHYGRDLCVGLAPTLEPAAHAAFIVKRRAFKDPEDLKRKIERELGLRFKRPLKGTGRIHYGYSPRAFAVGDAKLSTHPFLGLGMKHAILSARLMARLIAAGKEREYDAAHRNMFRRFHWGSTLLHLLNAPPLRFMRAPLASPPVFRRAYAWLHGNTNV
jgi:flavin-dependent dehydrogenase